MIWNKNVFSNPILEIVCFNNILQVDQSITCLLCFFQDSVLRRILQCTSVFSSPAWWPGVTCLSSSFKCSSTSKLDRLQRISSSCSSMVQHWHLLLCSTLRVCARQTISGSLAYWLSSWGGLICCSLSKSFLGSEFTSSCSWRYARRSCGQ